MIYSLASLRRLSVRELVRLARLEFGLEYEKTKDEIIDEILAEQERQRFLKLQRKNSEV